MKRVLGFTLLEVVIVMIITGIFVTAIAPMVYQVSDAVIQGYSQGKNDMQARYAMERIARELREIRSNDASDFAPSASAITFTDIDGNSVTYALSSEQLLRNSSVLSDNVTAFSLTYYDQSGAVTATSASMRYIGIALTVSDGNASIQLKTTVFPRSFA